MTVIAIKTVIARSDERIPKLRSRGRANRQKLLAEAQRLIESTGAKPAKFSDVFEAAGVSRGSAYRIYDDLDDLMQDLTVTWIDNFVAHMRKVKTDSSIESWNDLSDRLVVQAARYWVQTEVVLRVLPRVQINMAESYKLSARQLTITIDEIFRRYYVIPDIPNWLAVLGMYVQLGDTIFADAVRRDGYISEHRLVEAQKICNAYLSFYLPTWLTARDHQNSDQS